MSRDIRRGIGAAFAAALLALLAIAPAARAGNAYVANSGDGTVTIVNPANSAILGAIALGGEPVDLALVPDGSRLYVVDRQANAVRVVDTATNGVVAVIPVGKAPRGIAIAPNGATAFVSNSGDDTVTAFATATNGILGPPIAVGDEPDGVAITPDGATAFVAQRGGDVAAISVASRNVIGSVPDPGGPARIAMGPRGGRGFVTDSAFSSVTVFNPGSLATIGFPIAVGGQPEGIAIERSGTFAYAASPVDGTVTPFNTSLNVPSGGGLPAPGATGVAFRPDGKVGYVTNAAGATMTILDTTANSPVGTVGVGQKPVAVAFAPNQGPRASLWISPIRRRARKALTFHGTGSTDADGKIADYAFDFGDGHRVSGASGMRYHRYRRPGTYYPTLVVSDDQGCSTEVVFTGQTVSCNGGPPAVTTVQVDVLPVRGPILKVRAARGQRLAGSVKVRARCPRVACWLRGTGVAIGIVGEGVKTQRRKYRVRPATARAMTRGWRTLRLRLPGGTRRALRRAMEREGKAVVRASVVATDALPDQSGEEVKITLRR